MLNVRKLFLLTILAGSFTLRAPAEQTQKVAQKGRLAKLFAKPWVKNTAKCILGFLGTSVIFFGGYKFMTKNKTEAPTTIDVTQIQKDAAQRALELAKIIKATSEITLKAAKTKDPTTRVDDLKMLNEDFGELCRDFDSLDPKSQDFINCYTNIISSVRKTLPTKSSVAIKQEPPNPVEQGGIQGSGTSGAPRTVVFLNFNETSLNTVETALINLHTLILQARTSLNQLAATLLNLTKA